VNTTLIDLFWDIATIRACFKCATIVSVAVLAAALSRHSEYAGKAMAITIAIIPMVAINSISEKPR